MNNIYNLTEKKSVIECMGWWDVDAYITWDFWLHHIHYICAQILDVSCRFWDVMPSYYCVCTYCTHHYHHRHHHNILWSDVFLVLFFFFVLLPSKKCWTHSVRFKGTHTSTTSHPSIHITFILFVLSSLTIFYIGSSPKKVVKKIDSTYIIYINDIKRWWLQNIISFRKEWKIFPGLVQVPQSVPLRIQHGDNWENQNNKNG